MPGSLFRSAFTRPGVSPADVLAFHRGVFGDARMSNDDPTTPPAAPTTPPVTPPVPTPPAARSLDEVVAELGLTPEQIAGRLEASKTWERRAKSEDRVDRSDYEAVKAERDQLKQANETDTEKAVREARDAGKAEARTEVVDETVKALLRMGLRARNPEITDDELTEVVSTINLSAHADDKGLVDDEKVLRTINRLAGTAGSTTGPDTGQGNRGKQTTKSGVSAGAELFAASRGKKTTTS